jgi:hypothetical protein
MKSFSSNTRYAGGLVLSVVLGFIGGSICGGAILSMCALSGRIQTTGENYVGFWDYGLLLIGSMYGGPLGAILGPVAYVTFARRIGFKQVAIFGAVGTIIGGYAGALIVPALGVPTGLIGFFVALLVARMGYSGQRN